MLFSIFGNIIITEHLHHVHFAFIQGLIFLQRFPHMLCSLDGKNKENITVGPFYNTTRVVVFSAVLSLMRHLQEQCMFL